MENWDDENFEPPTIKVAADTLNKWEGEDEEEDVKDNWEDEDEEKPQEEVKVVESKKPKKKLAEKIMEKERQKEEAQRKLKEQMEEEELTPEERMKRQQESDLKLALETTFGGTNTNLGDLPSNKDEFNEFGDNLAKKLALLSKHSEYSNFSENLIRNLCAPLPSIEIKKIKNSLDNLYLEKQKIEKGDKSKKNKGKGKVKLKVDDANPLSAYVNDFEDYDDFM